MEKTHAGSGRYPRNSERAQDDRTVKWRTVDGKLLLDPGKKGVYSSYTPDRPRASLRPGARQPETRDNQG